MNIFALRVPFALWLLAQTAFHFTATNVHAAATEPYGLDAMTQFDRLPYLKTDTMAVGQSSFDRSGGNADAGNFLYVDGTNKVLLDIQGPGTVYRLWFTGFDTSVDYIQVFFDGETTPRINLLLNDLFSGTNAPFLSPLVGNEAVSSGGYFCYLPLPFKKSIKIVSNGTSTTFTTTSAAMFIHRTPPSPPGRAPRIPARCGACGPTRAWIPKATPATRSCPIF